MYAACCIAHIPYTWLYKELWACKTGFLTRRDELRRGETAAWCLHAFKRKTPEEPLKEEKFSHKLWTPAMCFYAGNKCFFALTCLCFFELCCVLRIRWDTVEPHLDKSCSNKDVSVSALAPRAKGPTKRTTFHSSWSMKNPSCFTLI